MFTRLADEALAVFGYPEAHDQGAERAVRAGLDLVERIGKLRSPANQPLQVHIGVSTGLAVIGPGPTVVGESPAVAAGLRNLASANSVLIAESTRKLLSSVLLCEDVHPHKLAGFPEAVNACRVVGRVRKGSKPLYSICNTEALSSSDLTKPELMAKQGGTEWTLPHLMWI
jgi:class 3 adenylate cyclase